jgi:hypothetical protein
MNKYIIHGQSFNGDVTLVYDYDKRLKSIEFDCDMTDKQHAQFIAQMPLMEDDFIERAKRGGAKYTLAPTDLSFDAIWNKYNYKVGNKSRAEKLWNTLNDAERTKVFASLSRYNYYLKQKPQIEKLYLETYLSQKRYESQFV